MKKTLFCCVFTIALATVLLPSAIYAQADDSTTATESALQTLKPRVKIVTNMGDIIVQLHADQAPITVENFLRYVDEGFYDGTVFHRNIEGFMIQGGGYDKNYDKKTEGLHDPIKNEWRNGRAHLRSTLAMARLGGKPDSAQAQFFINLVDNAFLGEPQPDGAGYANFGHVVSGMDVVDAIAKVDKEPNPKVGTRQAHTPKKPVVIESIKMIDDIKYDKIVETITAQKRAYVKQVRSVFPALEKEFNIKIPELRMYPSGLMMATVKEGSGRTPNNVSQVRVHYKGVLLDGTEFDSSYSRNKPSEFGLNRVIKAWAMGLSRMKEGEMAVIVAPPHLAYGNQYRPGPPPIPANSTLVFVVELKKILGAAPR